MKKDSNKEGLAEGQKVEVFLHTPLFRFRYRDEKMEKELLENTVRVSGIVTQEIVSGITIKVEAISNMKTVEKKLPFKEIFIPYTKIDFIVLQ